MGAPKNQISPIPPSSYGERFIKFISGLTMTREDQEREGQSGEQLDGSVRLSNTTNQRSSFNLSRKSTDRVVERAEKQAGRSEEHGAVEDERRDRTISVKRTPSAERTNGVAGSTLPVVEEDREASSREESLLNEKRSASRDQADGSGEAPPDTELHRPISKREKSVHGAKAAAILESPVDAMPPTNEEDRREDVLSIRNQDGDKPPPTPEKDARYQSYKHQSLPRLPPLEPLKFVETPRIGSPAVGDSGEG